MDDRNRKLRLVGVILFAVGALLGLLFLAASIWGDVEASLFDSGLKPDAALDSYTCPVMITRDEVGTVRAGISNSLDRTIKPLVRMHISDGHITLIREIDARPEIAAGETFRQGWEVSSEDAVWGMFIFARLYVSAQYPLPSRGGTCGILVADIPVFTGAQVVGAILAVSIITIVVGIVLWAHTSKPMRGRNQERMFAMIVMSLAMLVGIVISMLGAWIPAIVMFVIAAFLGITLLTYLIIGA
ncbi:MAG: hypothetical protein JW726_08865 [Anaerolineales bacterium]|nr:hypothetical protein [Anaerolineales bacterium]